MLNRILAIVKINRAVIKVIIRRFRRSPFLVDKKVGFFTRLSFGKMIPDFEWLCWKCTGSLLRVSIALDMTCCYSSFPLSYTSRPASELWPVIPIISDFGI